MLNDIFKNKVQAGDLIVYGVARASLQIALVTEIVNNPKKSAKVKVEKPQKNIKQVYDTIDGELNWDRDVPKVQNTWGTSYDYSKMPKVIQNIDLGYAYNKSSLFDADNLIVTDLYLNNPNPPEEVKALLDRRKQLGF